MPIMHVALVFDHEVRPEMTGAYVRRAIGQLVEVEHFLPCEISRIPSDRFDLFLNIDDGLRYRFPSRLKPSAWWAIDTHMDLPWCVEKSRDFDFVFAAQREGAASLRQAGIDSAAWLQLACDPDIHCRRDAPKSTDLCFIGNLLGGERSEAEQALHEHHRAVDQYRRSSHLRPDSDQTRHYLAQAMAHLGVDQKGNASPWRS